MICFEYLPNHVYVRCDAEVPLSDTDLKAIPKGDWFCVDCSCKKSKKATAIATAAAPAPPKRGSKRGAEAVVVEAPAVACKRSTRSAK